MAAKGRAQAGARRRSGNLDAVAFAALPEDARAPALVVAVGEESFLKREVYRAVVAAHPRGDRREVDGAAHGLEVGAVLDELRSPSLFHPTKVVCVRSAEAFVAAAQDGILDHAERAPAGRTLLLELAKLDKRTRFGKSAGKLGTVVLCKKMYAEIAPWESGPAWDTELARWVARRCSARGKRLSTEAAYHLTEITGNDLFEVEQTIEKLVLLLGEREEVRVEDLEQVAAHTRRESAFAVADAVGSRRFSKALSLLRAAFRHGLQTGTDTVTDRTAIGIIIHNALHRTYRELRRARPHLQAPDRPSDPRALAQRLGVAPFAVRRVVGHVQAHQRVDLDGCFRALLQADLGIKGREGPEIAMEQLLARLRLAGPRPAPRAAAVRAGPGAHHARGG